MCVGFWSLEHPDYALNRDEYLSRPTAPAHFHSFEKLSQPEDVGVGTVLSGRDLRAGGSWLGLNRTGRVAVLTNITEEAGQYSSTRGELVSSFLLPDPPSITFEQHAERLVSRNVSYAGFNELLLSPTFGTDNEGRARLSYNAAFVTNSGGGGSISVRVLSSAERECGGISNGVDGHGADSWPKVKQGTKLLSDVLQLIGPTTADAELAEQLFSILAWVFHSS
ncbi:hypothetical protein NLI96_g81 [Meripilus lineatus]|uniref:DUF833-domain-containing protein n=1 Tax=Meripilus lineatus TaxID=2056292 RepID=A0AAD5VD20_9APHY|nr:hypothetical protein NLI96_g81 [Physisporinus lineatus]